MPLTGIKVLDISRLIPGPFCSMVLADFGADVIKVEEPGRGDYMRWIEPLVKNQSAAFLVYNRNKSSITLNLKSPEGIQIFYQLVKNSDVVLEGFRPETADRLGVGYEKLRAINPGLIYCAISGYGQDGPYKFRAGHDINYNGLSGILGLTGKAGEIPVSPAVPLGDLCGSLQAVIGILLALMARERTGAGQYVDVAMLDGLLPLIGIELSKYATTGRLEVRGESAFAGGYLCNTTFETADGKYITLGILEDKFWHNFCSAVGRPELKGANFLKPKKDSKLYKTLQDLFKSRTRSQWEDLFRDQDVCFEPVLTLDEVIDHPQIRHRKMVVETEHPSEGTLLQVGITPQLSETPGKISRPAPEVGQHTAKILNSLGYSSAKIGELHKKGVV